ncbi:MAG: hypothetical protein M5R36_27760 [Deltaproteobacteria bacterium]|nr:hypothetical protein [Deltaproteobacteria bacterium]
MPRKDLVRVFVAMLAAVSLALLFGSCTESCYKQEEKYADAGDAPSGSPNAGTQDGCQVGDVHYQADMIHPDRPCLVCAYLDDGQSKGWIPLPDGAYCDDGQFCTGEGFCDRGRCLLSGNPCPDDAPFCDERFGGVCTDEPVGNGSYDDDAADDDDATDDDCWVCVSTAECQAAFGIDGGCLNGCCEEVEANDDDDTTDGGGGLDDDTSL